jgi:Cu/Zn superoxide dismutase
MKPSKLIAAVAALAIACVALASAAGAAPTMGVAYTATLNAKAEVPAQVVKNAKGVGSFTSTLTGSKLTWKLTFSKLTGPAIAAHIHMGKVGKSGNVVVPLCAGATCKSGVHGTAKLTAAVIKALKNGSAYVNVHTSKNPNGEIRGQITP